MLIVLPLHLTKNMLKYILKYVKHLAEKVNKN